MPVGRKHLELRTRKHEVSNAEAYLNQLSFVDSRSCLELKMSLVSPQCANLQLPNINLEKIISQSQSRVQLLSVKSIL